MTVLIPLILLFVFLIAGVPIGFSFAISAGIGIWMISGFDSVMAIFHSTPYAVTASFTLTTIPMFILLAELISSSGFSNKLFYAGHRWLGHYPGGLGMATIATSSLFGAVAGSSTVASAVMAKTAIPEMRKYKYDDQFSVGVVAIAGTLALLIPPSLVFIIFGVITDVRIDLLLMSGIVPAILSAIGYAVTIFILVKMRPEIAPRSEKYPLSERFKSLTGIWPVVLLIGLIVMGIYTGIVTPSEAAAVGAFFALVLVVTLVGFKLNLISEAVSRTIKTTAMIFTIIIGAQIFSQYLTITQSTQKFINFVSNLDVSPYVVMLVIILIYLILGFFMDTLAILFLTLPLTFPLAMSLGFDEIWFAIIVAKTVEIGLITPPVGMNVLMVANTAKVPLVKAFKGVAPFLITEFILLAILFLFPILSTYLPNLIR